MMRVRKLKQIIILLVFTNLFVLSACVSAFNVTGRSITVNRRLARAVQVQDSLAVRVLYMQHEVVSMYNYLTGMYPTQQEYLDTLKLLGYFVDCEDRDD